MTYKAGAAVVLRITAASSRAGSKQTTSLLSSRLLFFFSPAFCNNLIKLFLLLSEFVAAPLLYEKVVRLIEDGYGRACVVRWVKPHSRPVQSCEPPARSSK